MKTHNCPNCTAPITGSSCPYCGTVFETNYLPFYSTGGAGGAGVGGSVFIQRLFPAIDRLNEMEAKLDKHRETLFRCML